MTNKERQRSLDRKKWYESIAKNSDQSGKMVYCEFCDKCDAGFKVCRADQYVRENGTLCATAFNRMKRR